MSSHEQFINKKVFVTGASGFIGSHLCKKLMDSGAEVHGISRRKNELNYCSYSWQGDTTHSETVGSIISDVQPDYIYHLASLVSGSRDLDMVLSMFHNNLTSTVNILTAAAKINCQKIILAGSMEEVDYKQQEPVPGSPYAAAKTASSLYARMMHKLYEVPCLSAKIFMVYGPGQKDLNKLIPYVILSLLKKEIPKLSSGKRLVDWIYIDDVVDGLTSLAQAEYNGKTIDLGSGQLQTIRRVVEIISQKMKDHLKPQFNALPDRPMENEIAADASDTFRKIKWKSKINLETGLERTIDYYREFATSEKLVSAI